MHMTAAVTSPETARLCGQQIRDNHNLRRYRAQTRLTTLTLHSGEFFKMEYVGTSDSAVLRTDRYSMTTERPLPIPPSPSPSPSKYTFPSPIRNDPNLKPNPHPYAVKTTTSGLLTRSNSSSHNADTARHYYVPLSPKASRSPESDRGHKASKSLNNLAESPTRSSPRPLPVPPGHLHSQSAGSFGVFEDEYVSPRRNKRADTLPSFGSTEEVQLLTIPEDLPSNPKTWAPAQLSTYLVMALRVTDHSRSESAGLPIRVAKDIAAFAKSRMITGRMFLRLSEAELESMGMNRKWREALLAASHELRQNVLKGRIWGPEVSPTPSPGSTSPLPPAPFSSSLYNSSSSSLELSADEAEGEAHLLSGQVAVPANFHLVSESFSATRVYAIGGRAWQLAIVTFALGLVPVGLNLFSDIRYVYTTAYIPSFGTTYRIKQEAVEANMKTTTVTLLLRDGTFYFIVLLVINVLHLTLSLTNVFSDVTYFSTASATPLSATSPREIDVDLCSMSSVIVSRFLLNLRQVHMEDNYPDEQPSFVGSTSRISDVRFASTVVGNLGAPLNYSSTFFTNGDVESQAASHNAIDTGYSDVEALGELDDVEPRGDIESILTNDFSPVAEPDEP
ncbi:hypothetical protein POSPLADRAFT_1152132 [Postia placenta MAD-698-R-SB12]|uniref:SAM domain-containing protein n=1 Tax=Postia placenta MAD-698-R-SB12 TaxID=670580 RepID=A0A1X6MSH5_9APHY|nr:hypothetical protein POSPLADRAFT_1152132 [Postia placenta MAD-698-R-SB12]OSX59123.1 hypothetical protein POSPLADRAFT_1152132 [Postia placenta MAD-698-R-SB12]